MWHGKTRLDDKSVSADQMGIPEKVANFIIKLMQEWKTRLEVTKDRKVLKSRTIINTRKVSCKETAVLL